MGEDDDIPQLSGETFAALQSFYQEQEEREAKLIACREITTNNNSIDIPENWQLSQFWYDNDTINRLTDIASKSLPNGGTIALVSCPSLYRRMKNHLGSCEINLYEFDERFSIFGTDYMFYDYRSPLNIPRDKSGYYDLVIADPPFLSDECLTKTALTIKYIGNDKFILCTGATMEKLAHRLLDLKKSSFVPHHKNNLANEFCCFTNYDVEQFLDKVIN